MRIFPTFKDLYPFFHFPPPCITSHYIRMWNKKGNVL
nr:MAG TPA: hypothetical protein [Bacteriophage sp.]DAR26489.1 MAG TPA: hypothetical protein [Caudoviricetes sp.]